MIGMERKYFDWLVSHVTTTTQRELYLNLFEYLHNTTFLYSDPLDSNRAEDGVNLRYTFGDEKCIPSYIIDATINDPPCSMLEMMVGLAMRIEDQIMYDPERGDRTSKWFFEMLYTLGIGHMAGNVFDPDECDHVMYIFNKRMYRRNGVGGLFSVKRSDVDFRELDIWKQAMIYLSNLVKEENNA